MSEHFRGVVHRPGALRRGLKRGATLGVGFFLFACSGPSGATQAVQSPAASPTTSSSASAGPGASGGAAGATRAAVTLTGALAKTYTTTDAAATKASDRVIIAIFEPGSDTCSLSLELPVNSPPGTYKVGNSIDGGDPDISALYTTLPTCSPAATELEDWEGQDGTITLTESGTTWSGTFDVNITRPTSPAELVKVTGSFSGLNMR